MKMAGKVKTTKMEEEAPLEATVLFGSWVLNWTGIFSSRSGICLETGGCRPAADQAQLVAPCGVVVERLVGSGSPAGRCAGLEVVIEVGILEAGVSLHRPLCRDL